MAKGLFLSLVLFSVLSASVESFRVRTLRLLDCPRGLTVEQDHDVDGIEGREGLSDKYDFKELSGQNHDRDIQFVTPWFLQFGENRTGQSSVMVGIGRAFYFLDFEFAPQRKLQQRNSGENLLINAKFKDVLIPELFRVGIVAPGEANDSISLVIDRRRKLIPSMHISLSEVFVPDSIDLIAKRLAKQFISIAQLVLDDQPVIPSVSSDIKPSIIALNPRMGHASQSTSERERRQPSSVPVLPIRAPKQNERNRNAQEA